MDLGVYPISFTFRTLGFDYQSVSIHDIEFNEFGADLKETIEFTYADGVKAICKADTTFSGKGSVTVWGEKGKIVVDSVNCPSVIRVYDNTERLVENIECAPPLGGFEYQILASKEAIQKNKTECEEWTHANSIAVIEIVEKILKGNVDATT